MTDDTRALALVPVSFDALASVGAGLLRSPVSGHACVYWRVRIAQRLTDRSQLVHEIASEEAFELRWGRGGNGAGDVRVRIAPDGASIQAPPVLHREGTPGAEAAALYFGLAGPLSVEETLIRAGEALAAEGVLSDLDAAVGAGPLRGTSRGPELLDATVTVETKSLGPVLLPWALGTAAALMSGMGLATYAAWRAHLLTRVAPISSTMRMSRLFNAQLQPPELPHPRFP
ncbi:MAG TPA: hypothetical protein VH560_16270 [Polyangia bacterium]|jgi:hypothetical protein|nr:hypothetical protein [Polyangia bacterium]